MSVRLSDQSAYSTLAGVAEVLERGDRAALGGLLHLLIEQPRGEVAERVCTLYERVKSRGGDPEFTGWPAYRAAQAVCLVMRGFPVNNEPSPAVLHALYTLAEYPALETLARVRTSATRLDGRACAALYREAIKTGELDVDGPPRRSGSWSGSSGCVRKTVVFWTLHSGTSFAIESGFEVLKFPSIFHNPENVNESTYRLRSCFDRRPESRYAA